MANKSGRFSKIINLFLLILLFFGFLSVFLINNYLTQNSAPSDSDAIFGGRLESGYEFAGYVLSDLGETLKICSAVFISPTQAVTAAHCLDNDGEKFVGLGNYTSNRSQYFNIKEIIIHPNWQTYNKVENDMAMIVLTNPVNLSQYAQIAEPTSGCGFVVVGYGKQDNSENFRPLRKSADICIESVNYLGNAISFSGRDGGLCFGDSGSGVFIENTNKLVTIASSIDSCYINNFAAGAQIAGKFNFNNSTISELADLSISCGYLDTQSNNIIDQEDIDAFKANYLSYCNDSGLVNISAQCGPKDINKDSIINLEDLSLLAKKYSEVSCQ